MNKTYRSIWNAVTSTWTAAAETAKSHSKGSSRVARQAVIAIALGSASIGGAMAAEACTAEDGSSGTVDAAGVCKVAGGGTISTTGSIGTMAADDTTYVKVNSTATAASAGTTNSIAIGPNAQVINGGVPGANSSIAIGNGATAGGTDTITIGTNARHAGSGATVVGAQASAMGSGAGVAIGINSSAAGNGAVALGANALASGRNAIALGTGSTASADNSVSIGSATQQRRLTNLAAGTADTDAVNVGQMNAGLSTTNASIAATNTALSTTNTTLAATNTALSTTNSQVASLAGGLSTANTNIATHTTEITTLNDKLNELSSGTVGLVQQAGAGDDLTVGANTDGGAVNFAGTAGARRLSGIAAGTADTDAVNVGQMNAGLSTTNAAIAATNAELSTTNTTLAATNTALSTTNSQVASLEGGLSAANTNIATHTTEISTINGKLGELSSGTLGLVQQAAAGADLTVGANTDGGAVNFAGTGGARKLTGVAAGDVSAASTEAVNGAQLHGVSDSVASAIGGGAAVNPDGSISAPSFTVGDGSGGTKVVNSVGDVVTNIDGRTTANEGDIKKLADDIGSGTLGLVQQTNPGDDITVGANTDGNAVNFSSKTGARKLTGIAAGDVSAASTEAVNGSQLHGVSESVASAIGGGATVNPDGSISAPSFTVGDGSGGTKIVNSVGDVVTNLDGRTTANEGDIKKLADDIGSGTLGLVQQTNPGDDITVGANTDGNAVNFSSKTGARKLTGVAAGDVSAASTEAVNGSQLHGVSDSVASAIGGGAAVNPDGSISAPSFTVGDGSGGTKIVNSVGDVVTNLDGRVTQNEGSIKDLSEQLGSGTVGLVQQAAKGDDITVGANTDGRAVDFTGTAGARKLAGVAAGDVSAASNEAVNGSQLYGVSNSVASAIGGGSIVNPDGSISVPSFTVGDGSGGTKIVNSVGDVVTNLDGRTTTNEGDIKKLADDLGSGTIGLVQQANPGDDITVGANTDGNAVNFSSKTGARKLTGIAAGDVSATSTEAVNGAQLHGVSDSVASAIGGGATVNPDGSISAPSFTVGDGSGGTKIVNSVGDVVTNLDGRMTTNEGGLKKLSEQLESGELGLVQQNSAGTITVGATAGGTSVNFAGSSGARVLSGVANGVDDDDVVTVSQLRATGLIDYTGKEVGAVTYDSGLNFDTVTFAGTFGTKLQRVAAGEISATSMDAVNGSQLFDLQEQFAKQYGDLSGQLGDLSSRFGDLSDRLGDLEANPGTGGPGTGDGSTVVGEGAVASGENSSAIGDSALASGENASAVGQGAVASGNNGSAIGQGSVASGANGSALGQGAVASGENGTALGQGSAASGANGTAVGQGAVASGENSTSLGQGASATGSGSVAIGQGSVATEERTVSFGDGTAEGNRRLVNIADGINASDAATKGQLDRAMESVDARFNDTNRAINDVAKNAYAGIAAAMAMPNMTPSQPGKTVVAVGAANFKSGSAIAAGATYRSRNGNWLVNGATSITSVGDVGVRAQVGYEF
ncbi:ESPR-type extended signal peptide-containing protein [Burkholderia cenocepacia]|uniref:beta strand repeat-containing protein n=1 Tax=Burkholderia cenocepacia TaxID=95486 RepID=UPI0028561222|nr:ESPR-type extended signal peptide-containing protein [Burkholderia cenocepacia]MDR5665675.1 YadA-like family protein [Burkholderia cenocepacia]MDR5668688.1 YadA-like family protein [Burkholderia cenocepacia]MDR8096626.1 YadA-like family protein [Burkholderia cenocepacia]